MARIKQTFLIVVAFFLVSCAEGNPEAECGNGVLEMGEGCDDGNKRNNDSCPDGEGGTCQPARCGDGFLWNDYGGGEQCEDGNTQNYDGCNSICQLEALCGNGTIDPGETCDDGNHQNDDSCPDGEGGTCITAFCGDGFVWNTDGGSETCDDANNSNNDSCPDGEGGTCQIATCGDGFVWNTDGGTELCDDHNTQTGDGCSSTCTLENCGNGTVDVGETCDDGNQSNNDSCPDGEGGSCQPARCGDGFVWNTDGGSETCDDGNQNNSDSCPDGAGGTCEPAFCGDGFVWVLDGGTETCDDGNQSNEDSCPDGDGGDCQTTEVFGHTITIDGVNDFTTEETFATTSTGFGAYVTWDDTNVYLAISGSDIASGNGERIVSFYLGTGGTPGTTAGYLHNTQQSTLPFEATHYLLWSADNAFMELYNTDGLVWVVIPSHGVMAYQLDTFVEFAVPLSSLGASAPFTLELTGSMQSTTSGSEWTFAGYPQSSFTDQYNPVFSGYYQFQIGGPLAPGDYTPLP